MKKARETSSVPAPSSTYGGRLIGYGRVSTNDQDPAMQERALIQHGVHPDNLHIDRGVSGTKAKRKALGLMWLDLRPGDTLVVWKIDRLGRDLSQLIHHAETVKAAGADLRSLTEPIDTSTPMGKAFFHLIGAFAQLERDLTSERTRTRMQQLKAEGRQLGAKPKLDDRQWMEIALALRRGDEVGSIAKKFKVSKSLVRKHFQAQGGIKRLRALGPPRPNKPKAK